MDLRQVFINPTGRLRSGWRLLIFLLAYISLLLLLTTLLRVIYAAAIQIVPGLRLGSYFENVTFRLVLLGAAVLAGFLCNRWLEGLPWRALGLSPHPGWLRDFLVGSIIGFACLALATAIAAAGGGLSFNVSDRGALLKVGQTLILSAVLFIFAALAEEALARGYPLQTLVRARLTALGVFLTSIAFAGLHFRNPNLKEGLPYLNLVLAGVWLAVAYLRTRTLWFPLGIHWAWNWALGSVFGLPVSGITDIAPNPLFHGTDLGPAWLTGGNFGIEGGIACTVTLIVSTLFIWRTRIVSATDEMKTLTSRENSLSGSSVLQAVLNLE
ncbi:MAG: CPBP family intramembrane metalloprotease [Acidobacteriota bacterium]|nr:CPBP family intramembrane metalloprotease [Acidobacteriota bacterium]